jgi:hypothetical protein
LLIPTVAPSALAVVDAPLPRYRPTAADGKRKMFDLRTVATSEVRLCPKDGRHGADARPPPAGAVARSAADAVDGRLAIVSGRALADMPREERIRRRQALMDNVRRTDRRAWRTAFVEALRGAAEPVFPAAATAGSLTDARR